MAKKFQHQLKAGDRCQEWVLEIKLGEGGNGVVWRCANDKGKEAALKFLKNPKNEVSRQRFQNEITAMKACGDIGHVLPLLGDGRDDRFGPWFASPICSPLDPKSAWTLDEAIELSATLAETLAVIHKRGFSHRDIKPENIMQWADVWYLGDFGLVSHAEFDPLTRDGEKLGPIFYIAPEMLQSALQKDGSRADVYSLGKLIWKLGAGQHYPMPGMLVRSEPALTLSAYVDGQNTQALDELLERMTHATPENRPSMATVASELRNWLAPASSAAHAIDLQPFAKRIQNLVAPYRRASESRESREWSINKDIEAALKGFEPTLERMADALTLISLPVTREYVYIQGGPLIGEPEFPPSLYYVSKRTLQTEIKQESQWAVLRSGLNIAIRSVREADVNILDPSKTAFVAVGHLLDVRRYDYGQWQTISKSFVWRENRTIVLGLPSEKGVMTELASAFLEQLPAVIEKLADA